MSSVVADDFEARLKADNPVLWRRFVAACFRESIAGPRPVTLRERNQVEQASRGWRFNERLFGKVMEERRRRGIGS